MPQPNYMNNVMSRFGHHLSPNQRTHLSDSMISNLQSAKPGPGYLPVYHAAAASTSVSINIKTTTSTASGLANTGVTPMNDVVVAGAAK